MVQFNIAADGGLKRDWIPLTFIVGIFPFRFAGTISLFPKFNVYWLWGAPSEPIDRHVWIYRKTIREAVRKFWAPCNRASILVL